MARVLLALLLLLESSCQSAGAGHRCTNVQIDWVDFIEVGSTQYVAGPDLTVSLGEGDLGPVIAHVKFRVADNICDPGYRPQDGDAAFLEPGTPIYEVNGQPPSVMLAARHDGRIWGYRAQPASS